MFVVAYIWTSSICLFHFFIFPLLNEDTATFVIKEMICDSPLAWLERSSQILIPHRGLSSLRTKVIGHK